MNEMDIFFDPNLTTPANVAAIVGVFLVILNNTPQILKTIKTQKTTDFSLSAIILRLLSASLWFAYSLELKSVLLVINSGVSILSALVLFFYKVGTQ